MRKIKPYNSDIPILVDDIRIQIHRLLMKPPNHLVVDHIDRNPLNNQKSNLRVVTHSENMTNRATNYFSIGNLWCNKKEKRNRRWRVYINIEGIRKHIGHFFTEEEAIQAYTKSVEMLF